MNGRELRLRTRIDVLNDRIEALEQETARVRRALYAMRYSRDHWRMRALKKPQRQRP